MAQRKLDECHADRIERWFAQIWSSSEKYPTSLNNPGPHGGPVWEWLGWSTKGNAWKKYQASIPSADFILVDDSSNLIQMDKASSGQRFDVLLTANGFDHALLGAHGEHGQRFRQLFIDIKNQVWAARSLKLRGSARCVKADAQVAANGMAVACGRNPVAESVQGARYQWGDTPGDLQLLAEAETGIKVRCHSDALSVQALGLEIMRLGRQFSYMESAKTAAMEVVSDAKTKGWPTEKRFEQKTGRQYEVLEPRFDANRAMTLTKARRLNATSVVDLVAGKPKPEVQQRSLF